MNISNQFYPQAPESPKWIMTDDGFMRCKARVLMQSIMPYGRDELDEVPEGFDGERVNMYVPIDEIASEAALKSLEGMPIVAGDHTWMSPELVADYSMGNVSGTPIIDGNSLICDLLVTNPDAIEAIKSGKIGEISAAYRADTDFTPGEFNNEHFDCVQRALNFNHLAVIPSGHGRAGATVRILNKKKTSEEDIKMTVRVKLRNTGKYVNVDEEAAPMIEEDQDAGETKAAGMEDKMTELEGKNESLEGLQAEIEELKGELSVYKEKLDELLSEEAVEDAAEGMIAENEEAEDILENSFPEDEEKDEEKEKFKNSLKKVHGAKLHVAVLNAIGVQTDGMTTEAIRGAFKAQHQIANAMKGKAKPTQKVAGQKMFQNMATTQPKTDNMATLKKMGFPMPAA